MSLNETLIAELGAADRPLQPAEIRVLLGDAATAAEVRAALETLTRTGRVVPWRGGRVWTEPPASALPPLLRRLLDEQPRTVADLERALPVPLRIDRQPFIDLLQTLLQERHLHTLAQACDLRRSTRGICLFAEDPTPRLKATLEHRLAPEPQALSHLVHALASEGMSLSQTQVRDLLDTTVAAGKAYRWRKDVYSTQQAEDVLLASLRRQLPTQALSQADLIAQLPYAKEAGQKAQRAAIRQALSEGLLVTLKIPHGKSSRTVYGGPVAIARALMDDATRRLGIRPEHFREALGAHPATPTEVPAAPRSAPPLIDTLRSLRATGGSFIPIADVRERFTGTEEELSEALVALLRERRITVHEYVEPNPSPAEIWRGPSGRTFGGVTINEA